MTDSIVSVMLLKYDFKIKELGFPGGSLLKNLPATAGDTREEGLVPGSGRSSGAGNGNQLQESFLGHSMDRLRHD